MYKLLGSALLFVITACGYVAPLHAAQQPVNFSALLDYSDQEADEIIRYGDAESQFIELFLPVGKTSQPPLLIFIHGGCWLSDYSVDHARGLADGLRQQGFAVAAVEYRRLGNPGGGWPATRNDIEAAIEILTQNTNAPYQREDVTLIGHSAGGHLALLASESQQERPVRAVIGLAAVTDIMQYAEGEGSCQQAAARFVATAPSDQREAMTLSAQTLSSSVILLRGAQDTIVGAEQLAVETTQINIPEAGHFDLVHPETDAFEELLKVLDGLYPQRDTRLSP